MNQSSELLACPFCGKPGKVFPSGIVGKPPKAQCSDIQCVTHHSYMTVREWNDRTATPAPAQVSDNNVAALIKAARAMLAERDRCVGSKQYNEYAGVAHNLRAALAAIERQLDNVEHAAHVAEGIKLGVYKQSTATTAGGVSEEVWSWVSKHLYFAENLPPNQFVMQQPDVATLIEDIIPHLATPPTHSHLADEMLLKSESDSIRLSAPREAEGVKAKRDMMIVENPDWDGTSATRQFILIDTFSHTQSPELYNKPGKTLQSPAREQVTEEVACEYCGGCGWREGQEAGCCGSATSTGECCGNPIPVQTQEQCSGCSGTGAALRAASAVKGGGDA